MVDRTADVSPVKSHFPFAELQGLTARQGAFQRTHPRVRQHILDGLRSNDGVSYQDWQQLARIHQIQSQVDRLRAQQGRPSPYKPASQPQPWHNPLDETAVIRPPHRRAFRMAAAKTPGQQAADEFLNSSEYWDLVNQGTHPEHRDTEHEFPDYEEDYDVYPGYDEAGPSHDRAADRSWEDEPEENESEDSAYQREGRPGIEHLLNRLEDTSPQDEEEQYLHQQLRQDGFTFARNGEFRKTDEHGNWHTIKLPGDYRQARTMTTEFYNPRTEETITHTGHDNVDSLLDRYDINHSYSAAQKENPNLDYRTHFYSWLRKNPETYTAQKHRSYTQNRGYMASAGHRLTWDEIGERHPSLYGDPEVHGEAADGADGEGIGWAAAQLAFDRPGHSEPDEGSWDLDFHLKDVPISQIDFARHGAGDFRVRSAQCWYQESPDEVVPPVLVHRHGVYQVADGHHRGEAALLEGLGKIPAYVAQSPHEDEPFSDGQRGPFHGAEIQRTAATSNLQVKEYEGEEGNSNHITRSERGMIPIEWVRAMPGARGERPGEHRNRQGVQWEEFKNALRTAGDGGIHAPLFITVDHGSEPKLAEGNHRRDAYVEMGATHVPAEIRYFGHAERQGTVGDRTMRRFGAWGPDKARSKFESMGWSETYPGSGEFTRSDSQTGTHHNAAWYGGDWYLTSSSPEGWQLPEKEKWPDPESAQALFEYKESQHYTPEEVHAASRGNDAYYGGHGESLADISRPKFDSSGQMYGLDVPFEAESPSGVAGPFGQHSTQQDKFRLSSAPADESGIKAAGIAVIAMDTGRVLMQQRALNPLTCPCGLGVTWDESNGYQHDDGSVSHDDSDLSVSEMLDQGHPIEKEAEWFHERKPAIILPEGSGEPVIDYYEDDEEDVDPKWRRLVDPDHIGRGNPSGDEFMSLKPMNDMGAAYRNNPSAGNFCEDCYLSKGDQSSHEPNHFEAFNHKPMEAPRYVAKTAALEFDPNEGTWEFPGGKLDEGESPRDAAIREFREEVGQDLPPGVFVGAWVSPGGLVVSAGVRNIPPQNDDAERNLLWMRSEPAFERSREGDPMRGTHPEPDVSYEDFRVPNPGEPWVEGFHNLDLLDEPPHMNPFGGLEKLNKTASDWAKFDTNGAYRFGHLDGAQGNQQFYDEYNAKLDMGLPLDDWERDYLEGHIHGTERARENAAGNHVIRQMFEQAPEYGSLEHEINIIGKGVEKESAVAPVYKGFIYLIERERDIDLDQREIANPDDPDGDMSEQSAWWDIEHAKTNPALRKEVKTGTPWDELELWADKSVRSNKEIKEAFTKLAMPTTEHEPGVHGIEGSGEGSLNRRVTLPSGEWIAKSPFRTGEEAELRDMDEDEEDPDYWDRRQQEDVDKEVFASKLGRALSDPGNEPLVPEVIQGTKASDPGPTAYVRRYPEFREMDNGYLDWDDLEHHVNSQRGQQHGLLHTVLGDGDKLDHHNMLLLGDPMETSSEKIQAMPTVSIDHTRTTLPAYAEARTEDPDWAQRTMRFAHPNGEASDYATRHFVDHDNFGNTRPKAQNPLAPGDAERAVAAAETMRPWARQQGVEHWLDAAQDRMRGLGEHAAGAESMFPYRMAHEEAEQHVAAKRRPSLNGFQKIRDLIASGRPDLTIKPAGDMHYSEHDKIMASTYPEWNDEPGEPDFDRPQVYGLQTGAHVSFLAPVINNETGEHGWIRGSSKTTPENWKVYAHDQLNHAIKGTNPNRRVPQSAEERYTRGRASGKPPASAKPARQEFEGEVPLDERGHQIVGEPRRDPWYDLGLSRGFADEVEHGWKNLNYLEPEDVRHHNPEESVEHKNPEDALPWWAVS
jgi:8-oxo-dGTP pyrophosphatase MutT (NUDIX family)